MSRQRSRAAKAAYGPKLVASKSDPDECGITVDLRNDGVVVDRVFGSRRNLIVLVWK
jgi:hypothetical protein